MGSYCGNQNHNLHVPGFSIDSLGLHLPPVPPLAQSPPSSTMFWYPGVQHWGFLAPTNRAAKLQEHSTPIQLLILQSFTAIVLLLCFSFSYHVPPTQGGFFFLASFFSFPTSFLWESQRAALEPSLLQENFTAHLLYEHFSESYSLQTFEDSLFYSGDTS